MITRMNCISRIRVQVGGRTAQVQQPSRHRPICRDGRRSNGADGRSNDPEFILLLAAVQPTGLCEKTVTKIPVNIEALLSF